MIQNTEGIVLHSLRYGDTSRVVRIFTRSSGMKSFLVRIGTGPKSDKSICSVLNLVELSFHQRENAGLLRPSGLRRLVPLPGITTDPVKGAIALFLAEVLYKTLQEDYHNPALFDFMREAVVDLDFSSEPANLHLRILARLTAFYGFEPEAEGDQGEWFDLLTGRFSTHMPDHGRAFPPPLGRLFLSLFSISSDEARQLPLDNQLRAVMLDKMLEYLGIHLDNMREIHSHLVLHEVFRA